jgi:hypothetical protein
MKSNNTTATAETLEVSSQRPPSDGRRFRVAKRVSQSELERLTTDEKSGKSIQTDMLRKEMANILSETISKTMPISVVTQKGIVDGADQIDFYGDIYVFTPEELKEYNKNLIKEYNERSSGDLSESKV